jgi:DNA-binding YbaB/EbfC family protein
MFDMFKGMGQIAKLLQNLPQIQAEMGKLDQRLAQVSAEGEAGGGMVKARVNGRMEMTALSLSDDLLKMNDLEMMEELIKAAVNQALTKAHQQAAEESSKMMAGLGMALPAGMKLPGMS